MQQGSSEYWVFYHLLHTPELFDDSRYPINSAYFELEADKQLFLDIKRKYIIKKELAPNELKEGIKSESFSDNPDLQARVSNIYQTAIDDVQEDTSYELNYNKLASRIMCGRLKTDFGDILESEDKSADTILLDCYGALDSVRSSMDRKLVAEEVEIGDDIDELLAQLEAGAQVGSKLADEMMSRVINGIVPGTLTIRSAQSGRGKTALMAADAFYLAFPFRLNKCTNLDNDRIELEYVGGNQKVLFVPTEQSALEIRKMALAYLSGLNRVEFKREHKNDMQDNYHKRLRLASELLKEFSGNLVVQQIPEPSISSIKVDMERIIKSKNIDTVFFDYISVSPKLYQDFSGSHLRTDEALLLMTTELKNLATRTNTAIFTATQLNAQGDSKNNDGIKNESSLAGARSIINKADNGMIISSLTPEQRIQYADLAFDISDINRYVDIYKVRDGDLSQTRLLMKFDFGVLRYECPFIVNDMNEKLSPEAISLTSSYSSDTEEQFDDEAAQKRKDYAELIDKLNKMKVE